MKTLELQNVTTSIDQKKLLDNISFTLKKGKMMALVGHNGAGKSTLMKTIMHTLEKQQGKIMIMEEYDQDEHLLEFKHQLAFLPEEPMLLPELTVMQHFQLYGRSYQIEKAVFNKRVNEFVERFELTEKLSAYPEELSKGMRQKVQTICALLPEVSLLLIDEPFMGLDIYAIDYLVTVLKMKIEQGTSILLTTHQLEQAKDLADEFILLQHGKVMQSGPIDEFDSITRGSAYD